MGVRTPSAYSRLSKDRREHIALSWRLIEWKVAYYRPDLLHPKWGTNYTISDDEYEATELRYLALCRKLGATNTIVHKEYPGFEDMLEFGMMEVDETRPSVRLVITKLSKGPKNAE